MLASEALQRVLSAARVTIAEDAIMTEDKVSTEQDLDQEALKICTDILSVAVPLARFRCYVTVEKIGPKSRLGLGNFTVCGLDIPAIKNGLIGLSMEPIEVYAQLWEHREEGKFDMLSGYQGPTKTLGFRNWLKDIDRHQESRQTNNVQMPNVPPQS